MFSDVALADLFVELGTWYDKAITTPLCFYYRPISRSVGRVGPGLGRIGDGWGRVGVDSVSSWVGSGRGLGRVGDGSGRVGVDSE